LIIIPITTVNFLKSFSYLIYFTWVIYIKNST